MDIPTSALVRRLAEVVGEEKARTALKDALARNGGSGDRVSKDVLSKALKDMASQKDLLGIAAGLLRVKLELNPDKMIAELLGTP